MITGTLAVAQAQTQGTTLKEVTLVSLHVAVQSPLTRVTQPMSPYPCFFKTVYFDILIYIRRTLTNDAFQGNSLHVRFHFSVPTKSPGHRSVCGEGCKPVNTEIVFLRETIPLCDITEAYINIHLRLYTTIFHNSE